MKKQFILHSLFLWMVCSITFGAENLQYSWEKAQAEVDPKGNLEWAPEPFVFETGKQVRYIDFEEGDDANDGLTRASAWKHHPWDVQAEANAAASHGPITYIFKQGVTYRGALLGEESGEATEPIRLTVDPGWGKGEAVISGADIVKGWKKGTDHPDIPQGANVWVADVDYLPRRFWMVDDKGTMTRLKIARTPNWEITDPDNVLGDWWKWEKGGSGPNPDNPEQTRILGSDPEHINQPREYYEDAIVWTEYGFVMSTPIPARVEGIDTKTGTLAFRGIWFGSGDRAQDVQDGQRYYLEDKPHYLDQAGEIWPEKTGDHSARLYLRLPDGVDPNEVTIEAARRSNLLESTRLENVEVSGLTFQFNNRHWDITLAFYHYKDVDPGAIRIEGNAANVKISNCVFRHLTTAIIAEAERETQEIKGLQICDNDLYELDNKGIKITRANNTDGTGPFLRDIHVLRNRVRHVGMRTERLSNGASIEVDFPQTAEIAGNILDRVGGPGIFVFGGKRSGGAGEEPFTRILIHHNKVTDPLLTSNDWGGIETWQGGPTYVWNNVSGNPGGIRHWGNEPPRAGTGRFGFAYYLDGAFKNYVFNNIAWGKNNDLDSPLANSAAIQGIIGYQNTFLNNTLYKFVQGSRQQVPQAGRNKHLGNIWQDISKWVFYYASIEGKTEAEPNAAHVGQNDGSFDYRTMAWARNVFHDFGGNLGAFEETGKWFDNVEYFSKALELRGTLSPDAGIETEKAPLRDAVNHDFRLAEDSEAKDYGAKTFIPWSLYATVGEWPFTVNRKDPANIIDEHWYMTKGFGERKTYKDQPMYDLTGINISAADYVEGPLENWTKGALRLKGRDQYLKLENEKLVKPVHTPQEIRSSKPWVQLTMPEKIEVGSTIPIKVEFTEPVEGHMVVGQLLSIIPFSGRTPLDITEPMPIPADGVVEFKLQTQDVERLNGYVLNLYELPKGGNLDTWVRSNTMNLTLNRDRQPVKTVTENITKYTEAHILLEPDLRTPQIYKSNFLIEAYVKVEPDASGVIIQKMATDPVHIGYALQVDEDGHAVFAAGKGREHDMATLVSNQKIADGQWHHIIAEASRNRRHVLYIDGRVDSYGHGIVAPVDISNDSDLFVGGTPDGENLAMTIEFLRITRGTIAESQTTIGELYKWQFDGPQFRDFTGALPSDGKRDAGAIELK